MKPYQQRLEDLVKKDPIFSKIITTVNQKIQPVPSTDVYLDLLNSIVSQQLSTKVATIIWQRFLQLFQNEYPNAIVLRSMDLAALKSAGLSKQKAQYLKNVADFSIENDMTFDFLNKLEDQAIIDYLTQIKGVGKWTVQMILMFPMDRPNVFPVDDLGIQTKMKHWYQIDLEKKELKKELERIARKWSPNASIACKYLWASESLSK